MQNEGTVKRKHRFDAPDAYIVVFALIVIASLLTYVIPVGSFEVHEETYMYNGSEQTRSLIDPDSFEYALDENGEPDYIKGMVFSDFYETDVTGILNALHNAFCDGGLDGSVGMCAFILIIGGAFAVVIRTGAIDAGMMAIVRKMEGRDILLLPVVMMLFSLGGAVMGLAEELIPFGMVVVPLIIRLGYDGVTAMLTVYSGLMMGFTTSWMNPFSILIAQGIADVPLLSGAGLRIAVYIISMTGLMIYTLYRAKKYKNNPNALTWDTDELYFRSKAEEDNALAEVKFTKEHAYVLIALLAAFVWVFWGIMTKGWYVAQMSGQFVAVAIVCGTIGVVFKLNGMRINDIANSFKQGCADLAPLVMIIALAQGISLVLGGTDNAEPSILNTILHYAGEALSGLPVILSAWGMYLFQACFNFLVCSGPSQAAVVMPIMAPLSDILGVTRQTACLAFQLGDGFTNMINPTSGVLMAFLGITKIDFGKWVTFQWKMQLVLFGFGSLVMILAVLIGY